MSLSVIFIAGNGRSGSTLIDNILNEHKKIVSVGELCSIWDRGILKNQLCGCGAQFSKCDFWAEVLNDAFGTEMHKMDYVLRLRQKVERVRKYPFLKYPKITHETFNNALKDYGAILGALIKSIGRISNVNYVVDSSKRVTHGFVLSTIQGIDIKMLHLIRDSRAVCYSLQRKRVRPEIYWEKRYMPRLGAISSAFMWNINNYLVEKLKSRIKNCITLRYEDFVKNPDASLKNALNQFEINFNDYFQIPKKGMLLHENHTVAGNPVRFKKREGERIIIRNDDEWMHKMPYNKRKLITGLCYPWLRRYGYI